MAYPQIRKAKKRNSLTRPPSAKNDAALVKTLESIKAGSLRYQKGHIAPWLDEDGVTVIWSQTRIWTAKAVMSQAFETFMGAIIVFNLFLMVFETDQDAGCYPLPDGTEFEQCATRADLVGWLQIANVLLLVLYTLEVIARTYVERMAIFSNYWNILDYAIVGMGWLTMVVENFVNLSFLRIFRIARLLRAARVLISIREFYLLMTGVVSSMRAVFFGALLLLTVTTLWAIVAVQIVHPVNASIQYTYCERCNQGFGSVWNATITLFQTIIAGDSWGEIALPVIEKEPLMAIILVAIVITISLGIMNLILAVIVERAAEAREGDVNEKMRQKNKERAKSMMRLASLCAEMDEDGSGTLSLEEMVAGCEQFDEFQKLMGEIDLQKEDFATIFCALDHDKSGEVSYLELCTRLGDATERSTAMMLSLLKFSMTEVKIIIEKEVVAELAAQRKILERNGLQIDRIRQGQFADRGRFADTCAEGPPSEPDEDSAEIIRVASQAVPDRDSDMLDILEGLLHEVELLGASSVHADLKAVLVEGQLSELRQHTEELIAWTGPEGETGIANGANLDSDSAVAIKLSAPDGTLSFPMIPMGREFTPAYSKLRDELQERLGIMQRDIMRDLERNAGTMMKKRRIMNSLDQWLAPEAFELDKFDAGQRAFLSEVPTEVSTSQSMFRESVPFDLPTDDLVSAQV